MMSGTIKKSEISILSPGQITFYAENTGWQRIPLGNNNYSLYRRPEDENIEIEIPKNTHIYDYSERIIDIVNVIANFEKRTVDDVIFQFVTGSPIDIVKFSIDGPRIVNGTITLSEGIRLFEGAKKALLSSMWQVMRPDPFHKRLGGSEADSFLNNCRIGQTMKGSYVARFICPLSDNYVRGMSNLTIPQDSITRKTTKKLLNSINFLYTSIKDKDIEKIIKPDTSAYPISANTCDAILDMEPNEEDSKLSISASWAPVGEIDHVPEKVTLTKSMFPDIELISNELRPKQEEKSSIYVGKISKINILDSSQEHPSAEIHITYAESEDEDVQKAKFILTGPNYNVAFVAGQNGLPVVVEGVLRKRSRLSTIDNITSFSTIPQSDTHTSD